MSERTAIGSVQLDEEKAAPLLEAIAKEPNRFIAELSVANRNNVQALVELYKKQDRIDKLLTAMLAVLGNKGTLTQDECNAIFESVIGSEVAEATAEREDGEKTGPEGIITPDSQG